MSHVIYCYCCYSVVGIAFDLQARSLKAVFKAKSCAVRQMEFYEDRIYIITGRNGDASCFTVRTAIFFGIRLVLIGFSVCVEMSGLFPTDI